MIRHLFCTRFHYVNSLLISQDWRFNVLGQISHPFVQLLNQAEQIAFLKGGFFWSYDAFAAAAFIFPKKVVKEMRSFNATIELSGRYTRGEMIVDSSSTEYNVNIIERISEKEVKRILLWATNFEE